MLLPADNAKKIILSLFDYTGNWCRPYREAGYTVIQVDIKHGLDVMTFQPPSEVYGVLAAPPCTIWTNAAAWMWDDIPDDVYQLNCDLIDRTVSLCRSAKKFWVLENPAGRLGVEILGPHQFVFTPSDFGDPYTKRTWLWGRFNPPVPRRVLAEGSLCPHRKRYTEYPLFGARQINGTADATARGTIGKWVPKSKEELEARRAIRSATPPGFSRAFFEANP